MTALHTAYAFNGFVAGTTHQRHYGVRARKAHAALARKTLATLKNMALFLLSPFIGLVYAVLLPFVGLGMLLWVATEGLRQGRPTAAGLAAPQAGCAAAPAATLQVEPAAEATQAHGGAGAAMVAVKLVAAPFAGLAFIVAMPFVGVAALAWMGLKAAFVHAA